MQGQLPAKLLNDLLETLYFRVSPQISAELTRQHYRRAVNGFGLAIGKVPTTEDLTDDNFNIWLGSLRQTTASVETIRGAAAKLLAFWRFLAARRIVEQFPTVRRPKPVETLPIALRESQLRALFDSAAKERESICGIPAPLWWTSLLAFVFSTSERKGAALACRVEWLDLSDGWARIPPAARKGGRKWGLYQLWPEVLPLLRDAVSAAPNRELMWPLDFSEGTLYNRFGRIAKDAGLPDSRKYKFHSLRVSHATMLKVLGGDPSRQLGHSDPATTQRHYIDATHLPPSGVRLPVPWRG